MVDVNEARSRARRAAKRAGLLARKSRRRLITADDLGGFMLIEPRGNWCVAGSRFDLTAEDAVELCERRLALRL
jgi:hypothetical protein